MGAALKLKQEETPKAVAKPVGTVKAHEFFNPANKLMGYVKGEEIYSASHFKVAYSKAGNVYDNTNKKMISLSDAKKMMNCDYDGVTLAGFWYFFGRNK
ncbi:MAG: hypothetical protein WC635_11515 [Bacteriovorax sp.]|jgi:hypothetical protein